MCLYIDTGLVEIPNSHWHPQLSFSYFFKIEPWLVRHPTTTGCVRKDRRQDRKESLLLDFFPKVEVTFEGKTHEHVATHTRKS